MEISNEYKSRHGFADFEHNLFQITSGENVVKTCKLVKVPEYTSVNKLITKALIATIYCYAFGFLFH